MRVKRLETLAYARYEQHFLSNIKDPVKEKEQLSITLTAMAAPQEDIDAATSPTRDDITNSKAAKAWAQNQPLIPIKDLAKVMHIGNVSRWRYDNGLPKVLTPAQAAYALDGWPDSITQEQENGETKLLIQRTQSPTYGLISPARPSDHPLKEALQLAAERIAAHRDKATRSDNAPGSIAGRWRIVSSAVQPNPAAQQIDALNPAQGGHPGNLKGAAQPSPTVHHCIAECAVCGTRITSRIANLADRPCIICEGFKSGSEEPIQLPTIWITCESDGEPHLGNIFFVVAVDPPPNAIGKFQISHTNAKTTARPLSNLEQMLSTSAKQAEDNLKMRLGNDRPELWKVRIKKIEEDTDTYLKELLRLEVAQEAMEDSTQLEGLRYVRRGRRSKFTAPKPVKPKKKKNPLELLQQSMLEVKPTEEQAQELANKAMLREQEAVEQDLQSLPQLLEKSKQLAMAEEQAQEVARQQALQQLAQQQTVEAIKKELEEGMTPVEPTPVEEPTSEEQPKPVAPSFTKLVDDLDIPDF